MVDPKFDGYMSGGLDWKGGADLSLMWDQAGWASHSTAINRRCSGCLPAVKQ